MQNDLQSVALLDDLLATNGHVRVLRALLNGPQGIVLSAREVAKRASISHPRSSAVLSSLRDRGIVHKRARARLHLYELNRSHVAVPALMALFRWERNVGVDLLSFLKERLQSQRRSILAASLFGTAAWGGMDPDSDIDMAILARPNGAQNLDNWLDDLAQQVRDRYGMRLSPLVASSSIPQWPKKPAIWRRIEREGMPLVSPRR